MIARSRLFGAGAIAALLAAFAIGPAAAQQTPTPPPPTPNMPTSAEATKLRGISAPPFAAAADKLPVGQLKAPKGFKIEVYVSGIANARSLRLSDKGTLFVSNRLLDKVYAVVEKDGKREAKVIASGLDRPNGLVFHNGTLYVAEGTRISKLEKIEDNLDNPPKPVIIYSDFPNHQSHGWKFMGLGPDNKLYVNVGAPCNICMPPETNAQIRRINLDGSGAEVVARGVRNSVGFDWHPVTKELYFTDNGRDWLSEDLPHDELNRVTKTGQHFGYPFCHADRRNRPRALHSHSPVRIGAILLHGGARHALLHRQHVSGRIQERDLRPAPRLVEQDQEDRRRHHRREPEQGRHGQILGAVHHRIPPGQQLHRPAGRPRRDEGRLAPDLRRLRRRRLSRELWRAGRRPVKHLAIAEHGKNIRHYAQGSPVGAS